MGLRLPLSTEASIFRHLHRCPPPHLRHAVRYQPRHPVPPNHDATTSAPAESTDGLAPSTILRLGPLAGSTESAPMTPPMDCGITPHLRGVEYVLSASTPLPVTNCTSCLQPFREGETLVRLQCMHYFHKECVTRWFASSYTWSSLPQLQREPGGGGQLTRL